jgi:GNAT superfamily N-acetyltransferase
MGASQSPQALEPIIRPATARDLNQLWDIRYANDVAGQATVPAQGPAPPYLAHLLAHGSLFVAEVENRVAGYAGLVKHGSVAYLTDLFVAPGHQSATLGQRLLRRIMPASAAVRCTMATTDRRAIALYTRAGMAPRWPNLLLEASVDRLRAIPPPTIEMVPAAPDDPALRRWDHNASGRDRPLDLSFMLLAEHGQPFWFVSRGTTVGYGIVRAGAGRLWHPDAVTIGPIGAATPDDARECVLGAVRWARSHGDIIEMAVPGPHSALRPLLDAGCTIAYVETFCASAATHIDPARYIGSGGDLF